MVRNRLKRIAVMAGVFVLMIGVSGGAVDTLAAKPKEDKVEYYYKSESKKKISSLKELRVEDMAEAPRVVRFEKGDPERKKLSWDANCFVTYSDQDKSGRAEHSRDTKQIQMDMRYGFYVDTGFYMRKWEEREEPLSSWVSAGGVDPGRLMGIKRFYSGYCERTGVSQKENLYIEDGLKGNVVDMLTITNKKYRVPVMGGFKAGWRTIVKRKNLEKHLKPLEQYGLEKKEWKDIFFCKESRECTLTLDSAVLKKYGYKYGYVYRDVKKKIDIAVFALPLENNVQTRENIEALGDMYKEDWWRSGFYDDDEKELMKYYKRNDKEVPYEIIVYDTSAGVSNERFTLLNKVLNKALGYKVKVEEYKKWLNPDTGKYDVASFWKEDEEDNRGFYGLKHKRVVDINQDLIKKEHLPKTFLDMESVYWPDTPLSTIEFGGDYQGLISNIFY